MPLLHCRSCYNAQSGRNSRKLRDLKWWEIDNTKHSAIIHRMKMRKNCALYSVCCKIISLSMRKSIHFFIWTCPTKSLINKHCSISKIRLTYKMKLHNTSLQITRTKIDLNTIVNQINENQQPHLFCILLRLLPPCKQISSRSGDRPGTFSQSLLIANHSCSCRDKESFLNDILIDVPAFPTQRTLMQGINRH